LKDFIEGLTVQEDEDKSKDNTNGEVEDAEVEPSQWLVSKTAYFIPHLHIYLILNSANNTSLVCFYVHGVQWRRRP